MRNGLHGYNRRGRKADSRRRRGFDPTARKRGRSVSARVIEFDSHFARSARRRRSAKVKAAVAIMGAAAALVAAFILLHRPAIPAAFPAGATGVSSATPSSMAPALSPPKSESPGTPSPSAPPYRDERLEEATRQNGEVVGWITIRDTQIDYPVVQTKDNKYYLTHDAGRKASSSGAIFMDYRDNPQSLDGNIILYGHHMKNGSMFASLMQYKDKSFFDSHRVIELSTPEAMTTWQVFSAYVTDTDFYYIQTVFADDADYLDFLEKLQSKSEFTTDCILSESDSILTLSTCTYEYSDARFVVHAKRIQ